MYGQNKRPRLRGKLKRLPLLAGVLLLTLWVELAQAYPPERRRDFENRRPNEYLLVPAVASLPGIGVFVGIISSVSNIGDTGVDVATTAAESVDGSDIGIRVLALRDVPTIFPGLTFDYQYADLRLGNYQSYLPGRNSPNFTIPITARFNFQLIRPILRVWERRLEIAYGLSYFNGFEFDETGNEFKVAQHGAQGSLLLDLTDDVVDPRDGQRIRHSRSLHPPTRSLFGRNRAPSRAVGDTERITVEQLEYVSYHPLVPDRLILAWDLSVSQALGEVGDDAVVSAGTPPLRGYPSGRWRDRFGFFTGVELRYNLPQNRELDIFLARGKLDAYQWAIFYEVGQVSPKKDDTLAMDLHQSYGAGFRVLLDAIVLRLDLALGGDDGPQPHLTINHHY